MKEIVNEIPEYVLTAVISAVFIFAIKYVRTYVHNKALHAKTEQSKELWAFIDQIAYTAVTSMVGTNKTGNEKFEAATTLVQDALNQQGFKNVNVKSIEAAVQSAYEKSNLTGNAESIDPVKVAIKTAPNRSDQLLLQGKEDQAKG